MKVCKKVYKIEVDNEKVKFYYNTNRAHIVVAYSKEEVVEIVKDKCWDEPKESWCVGNVEYISDYTGESSCSFVLLTDSIEG